MQGCVSLDYQGRGYDLIYSIKKSLIMVKYTCRGISRLNQLYVRGSVALLFTRSRDQSPALVILKAETLCPLNNDTLPSPVPEPRPPPSSLCEPGYSG